jgi:hypothetical protein
MVLAAIIVVGTMVHGLLIDWATETVTKAALFTLVLAAAIKAKADLVRRMRAKSRRKSVARW